MIWAMKSIAFVLVLFSGAVSFAGELPADFDRGVNHAHVHRGDRGYGSPVSREELQALREIGINSIAITPFGYQQSYDADAIRFQGDRSMSDDHLCREAANAHALGIRVVLKPHIWSRDFWSGDQWHGTVEQPSPETHARWWADYRAMILHYAQLCTDAGIDTLCIGVELVQMTKRYPQEWIALIRDVRETFKGRVVYAAHWDRELSNITFWSHLDAIGVSAYFPIDAPDNATVEQLVRGWQPHVKRLEKLSGQFDRPVVFLEAGYRPVNDCYRKPWLYSGGEYDLEAQARAYDAMFTALCDQPWWHGVYIWKTFTDPQTGLRRGEAQGFVFRGLPAERIISNWFVFPKSTAASTGLGGAISPAGAP